MPLDGRQPPRGGAAEALAAARIVSEEEAHDAMEVLRRTIAPIGVARGDMVRAEAMLRHIKSLEMTFSDERSTSAQERDAYASDRYRDAIDAYRSATVSFETLKAERETASMVIEVYRTQRASERAATRM
ncbi:hypothetical protein [Falsiroseomonas sp. CW058]|uniref:hypothetical protein n=1 Tax=Falsiroseomonas sp. CW058 TaxID=3388664 RepID=UPI003D3239E2